MVQKQPVQSSDHQNDRQPFTTDEQLEADRQQLASGRPFSASLDLLAPRHSSQGVRSRRAATVLAMQRMIGNAATIRRLARPQTPDRAAEDIRNRAEAFSGYDLSTVEIQPESQVADVLNVEAVTVDKTIHISPTTDPPQSGHGARVLAHEFAHVIQQGLGETTDIGSPGRYERLEAQADATAARINHTSPTGNRLSTLATAARPAVQAFDPRYHRQSVVEGLATSGFTDEEIGQIYQANWERDFSQAHPALATVVLRWKEVKLAAARHAPLEGPIAAFEGSINQLFNPMILKELASGRAYEGYAFYEHMDNPQREDGSIDSQELYRRMETTGGGSLLPAAPPGVPPHITISREYMKTQLFNAAKAYRHDQMGSGSTAAGVAANFDQMRQRVADIDNPQNVTTRGQIPATVVGTETAEQSARTRQAQGITAPGGGSGQGTWKSEVADALGRASHALEDFFSHSNFVEIAIDYALGRVDLERQSVNLTTGTFGAADQKHSLAHKIRAVADEIDGEMALIERVTGRTEQDPTRVNMGQTAPPTHTAHEEPGGWGQTLGIVPTGSQLWDILGSVASGAGKGALIGGAAGLGVGSLLPGLGTLVGGVGGALAGGAIGGLSGLWGGIKRNLPGLEGILRIAGHTLAGVGAGAAIGGGLGTMLAGPLGGILGGIGGGLLGGFFGLRSGVKSMMRNVLGSRQGVDLLRRVAEKLEEETRASAAEGSHSRLAKDQPGHDTEALGNLRTIKFNMAMDCAKAADSMIIGKMREVLDAPSAAEADTKLQAIYKTLDDLISLPSKAHPFSGILQTRMDEAKAAQLEYERAQASSGEQGGHAH